ncbi:hypothetical protein PULV_a2850 [Pseudoalteromonas ulvae UL12]|nr:hypothetical protein [Pseudoalteromonas ulvae UL12]MBE0364499.1 hypothetical protein [Pseudoalteromonas ulvae UL12]
MYLINHYLAFHRSLDGNIYMMGSIDVSVFTADRTIGNV